MKQSTERCLKCLTAIYEDCEKYGSITNMSFYTETYGANASIGAALQRLGYIEKDGRTYTKRSTMRMPDERMANEVMDELNPNIPATSPAAPIIAPNLVPASQYKAKVKAEIQSEMIDDFMKAITAAKIIGVDLLSLEKGQIVSFVQTVK